MDDRIDIDALLIGALYGELTPADEARLTAHLESHPADRTALADLTRTRAAVRESRILAVQLEPPQSVSALLLQEAARRAASCKSNAEIACGGSSWNARSRLSRTAARVRVRSSSAVRSAGCDSRCAISRASSAGVSSP